MLLFNTAERCTRSAAERRTRECGAARRLELRLQPRTARPRRRDSLRRRGEKECVMPARLLRAAHRACRPAPAARRAPCLQGLRCPSPPIRFGFSRELNCSNRQGCGVGVDSCLETTFAWRDFLEVNALGGASVVSGGTGGRADAGGLGAPACRLPAPAPARPPAFTLPPPCPQALTHPLPPYPPRPPLRLPRRRALLAAGARTGARGRGARGMGYGQARRGRRGLEPVARRLGNASRAFRAQRAARGALEAGVGRWGGGPASRDRPACMLSCQCLCADPPLRPVCCRSIAARFVRCLAFLRSRHRL